MALRHFAGCWATPPSGPHRLRRRRLSAPPKARSWPSPPERPLLWTPDGEAEELKSPNGFGPAGSLRGVRGGWVFGSFKAPGKPDHEPVELVGDLRSGAFAPAGIRMAFGMNRHGWVAGFDAGPQRTQIPAIAGNGKKLTLPIPSGAKAADEISAASISDDGRTVGGTVMVAGTASHLPVRWTCQP